MTNVELSDQDIQDLATRITSREEYLAYVARWKAEYQELSVSIRVMKAARKPYLYEYRQPGTAKDGVPKRTRIGDNPSYKAGTSFKLWDAQDQATYMLAERVAVKALGKARMEAELQQTVAA